MRGRRRRAGARDREGAPATGPLIVRREVGGPRHFLTGQPVHAGTGLELRTADGSWVAGRYEWSFELADAPVLHVETLWGDTRVEIGDRDELRWPARWFGRP